jgi:hypothetical protein
LKRPERFRYLVFVNAPKWSCLALRFDVVDAERLTATSTFEKLAMRQRCGFERDAGGNMAGQVVKIPKGRAWYD